MPCPAPFAATATSRPRSRQASRTTRAARRRSAGSSFAPAVAMVPRSAASRPAASTTSGAAAARRARRIRRQEVEQGPAHPGAGEDGFRPGREPDGQPRAAARRERQRACLGGRGVTQLDQEVREGLDGQRREAQPRDARQDGGQERSGVVGTEHQAGARTGLLERLEKRVLGVRVEAVRGADDSHAEAALVRRQRQVGGELLDLADEDLLTGPLGNQPVDVGVVVGDHLATGRTGATRPHDRVAMQAQETRREVERQGRLAHATRPLEEQRVGRSLLLDGAPDGALG